MATTDLAHLLGERVADAVQAAYGLKITAEQAVIRPAAAGRPADFQCNAAMALGKRVGRTSVDVARTIVAQLDTTGLAGTPEVAGPGFINVSFDTGFLAAHVGTLAGDERLGVPRQRRQRVVVDYSAPNMAKEMHVGHLRSTIIGDALVRVYEYLGHEVIRHNHIGDWGTPFGMLVEQLADQQHNGQPSVTDLTGLYTQARRRFDTDPEFAQRARQRVVALYQGDPPTLARWRELVAATKRHIEAVYQLLGVRLTAEDYRGESAYADQLDDVAAELEARGLAGLSDGALCVFPPGFTGRDGGPLPLIVRKRDGGFGYGATDLATIRYRAQALHGDLLVYVVGTPQRLHLEMVFAVARAAGWLDGGTRPRFASFGQVFAPNGRMLRTREGANLTLNELLHEAVERAAAIVADRPDLDDGQRAEIARAVGIGGVKYADLSSDREKNYTFDWDRMLATDGNTAVYLQYAVARTRSVRRKADAGDEARRKADAGDEARRKADTGDEATTGPLVLVEPAERALALALTRFPAAVEATAEHLQPHRLCGYLYELAVAFSAFWQQCPVLDAGTVELRASRLALVEHTERVLVRGLDLLGIETPRRL